VRRVLLGSFSVLVLIGNLYSADVERPFRSMKSADLLVKSRQHSVKAIRELGMRKDKSAIGVLKNLASEPDVEIQISTGYIRSTERREIRKKEMRRSSRMEARIALARIGETGYLEEFIIGLSSSNLNWKSECIRRLAEIGDKRAVAHLIPILDDDSAPPSEAFGHDKMVFSFQAALGLKVLLPDVHAGFVVKHNGRGKLFRDDWKNWWSLNKDKFQIK